MKMGKSNFDELFKSIIAESESADIDTNDEVDETENESRNHLKNLIEEYKSKETITKDDIAKLLNIAICDELLASFNYKISYNISKTEGKADFDDEFKAHEGEEAEHANKLINRLRELRTEVLMIPWCDYITENSCGSDWKQEVSSDSITILSNRYNEELGAIDFYAMILDCIKKMKEAGDYDSSTEKLIKEIKHDEEEHALDLGDLLVQYGVDIEVKNADEMSEDEDSDAEDAEDDEDDVEDSEKNDESDTEDDENDDEEI